MSNKLGPQLLMNLDAVDEVEDRPVSVLMRVEGVFSDADRQLLEKAGAHVRTVAGDVVTATVALRATAELAKVPCVHYIELATPLFPEQSDDDSSNEEQFNE